ncbi:hypothetical protein [Heyndrickxia oleronia]|nr:hypothetical protein [Heyndrickxia oleronia]
MSYLMKKDVHYFIGISKEDAQDLLKEHPSIPHIYKVIFVLLLHL